MEKLKIKLIPKGLNGLLPILPPQIFYNNFLNGVRRRLYRNINPQGYWNPISRVFNAVIKNKDEHSELPLNSDQEVMDLLWAYYLLIPKEQQRQIHKFNTITINQDGSVSLPNYAARNTTSMYNSPYNKVMGLFTIDGVNSNPLFYSGKYSDIYDINPYQNNTVKEYGEKNNLLKKIFGKYGDLSLGIGRPFKIKGTHYEYLNGDLPDSLLSNEVEAIKLNSYVDSLKNEKKMKEIENYKF